MKAENAWKETEGRHFRPSILDEQVAMLEKLKAFLEMEEKSLQQKLEEAHEAAARIKHGGGR